MASGLELVYKGKEDKGEILMKTVPLPLYEVKRFGKNWSDNWYNMLIFGDNLSILRTLMDKPDIKGQIKVFTIEEALEKMPIPCKECTHKLYDEKRGFCRCRYVAEIT